MKNLKIRKKINKLDYVKVGPFFIKAKKKTIKYKFKLFKKLKYILSFMYYY